MKELTEGHQEKALGESFEEKRRELSELTEDFDGNAYYATFKCRGFILNPSPDEGVYLADISQSQLHQREESFIVTSDSYGTEEHDQRLAAIYERKLLGMEHLFPYEWQMMDDSIEYEITVKARRIPPSDVNVQH